VLLHFLAGGAPTPIDSLSNGLFDLALYVKVGRPDNLRGKQCGGVIIYYWVSRVSQVGPPYHSIVHAF